MELDYFPPIGTKYEWHPPVLKTRPWTASIELSGFPRSLTMYVTRGDDALYHGWVRFRDLQGRDHQRETGYYVNSLIALLATEQLAEALLAEQNLPAWAEEALTLGWRPPAVGSYRVLNPDACPLCEGQVVEGHAGGMCTTPGCPG